MTAKEATVQVVKDPPEERLDDPADVVFRPGTASRKAATPSLLS
jgi:hypothetical protein